MEKTPIEICIDGRRNRVLGEVYTRTHNKGRWKIDNELGKTLCLIEIKIPSVTIKGKTIEDVLINFTPSDAFQDDLIRTWMQAEIDNDNFRFKNPKLNATRPSMLRKKIGRIETMINKFKNRMLCWLL